MISISSIKNKLKKVIFGPKVIEASQAYDLWSATYDQQTNNPIIYLDDILFAEMISNVELENRTIVDVGCGTGRHWEKLLTRKPLELIGYDVSKEMLNQLLLKFPNAKTYLSHQDGLKELENESCDLIISNLVIGYIKDLSKTFFEWNRVLKNNGQMIITDFHPDMLLKGATRSFNYDKKVFLIRNYIHLLLKIESLASKMNWRKENLTVMRVDEKIKQFYEKSGALEVYNETFNMPIIYGIHFKKQLS